VVKKPLAKVAIDQTGAEKDVETGALAEETTVAVVAQETAVAVVAQETAVAVVAQETVRDSVSTPVLSFALDEKAFSKVYWVNPAFSNHS
jgi:hypothetical protein